MNTNFFLLVNPRAERNVYACREKIRIDSWNESVVRGVDPAYPSIDVTFHLRNLFYKSLDMVEGGGRDFHTVRE